MAHLKANPQVVKELVRPDPKEIQGLIKKRLKQVNTPLKKHYNLMKKRLMFTTLCYYTKWRKADRKVAELLSQKMSQKGTASEHLYIEDKTNEKVVIKQQLEVFDGTMEVYTSIRRSIVIWIYEIFLKSNHHLNQKKK